MSRTSLAPRPRSPKPATVVPFRMPKDTRTLVERAQSDLNLETEFTIRRLKGLGQLLGAWERYEREFSLEPEARACGLDVLEYVTEQMAERLRANVEAVYAARRAPRKAVSA